MKAIFYSVALLASAAVLVKFATYWNGGLGEGLGYALVGGYGNTVPALIAIVASLIGLLKTFLAGKSGALAFLSGKLAGMVLAIAMVLGVGCLCECHRCLPEAAGYRGTAQHLRVDPWQPGVRGGDRGVSGAPHVFQGETPKRGLKPRGDSDWRRCWAPFLWYPARHVGYGERI